MVDFMVSVASPLLLHIVVSELTPLVLAIVTGQQPDAAVSAAVTALLVLPVASWMYAKDLKKEQQKKKKSPLSAKSVVYLLLCFAAGGILNLLWSKVLALLNLQAHFSNVTQERLFAGAAAVQIVGLGVIVPVSEELVFRGLIYRRMKQGLRKNQAVFFSALLFAVYHGNVIQMVFAFPMALILALLYEKGNGLKYSAAFHIGVNLTAVVVNFIW